MDNFSDEKNEENLTPNFSDNSDEMDIQFEEVMDLDRIQRELKIQVEDSTIYEDENALESEIKNIVIRKTSQPEPTKFKVDPKDKKYVVYIDYDNIEFMENLSPEERKDMINKILKEQNILIQREKELQARAKFVKHLIIACITFIIGFPLLFILVNKALEASMSNYKEAKSNFTKLYQEQGKLKKNKY